MPYGLAVILASMLAASAQQASAADSSPTNQADCRDLAPPDQSKISSAERRLEAEDLVRLRDIGPANNELSDRHLFEVSPDGRSVAFQLRRGDPASNDYCLGMFVMELTPHSKPVAIDTGGNLIRFKSAISERTALPTGIPLVITPQWSPDSQWITFLKRNEGVTQVWKAMADGSGSLALTHSPHDVEDFRLLPDGRTLLFSTRPSPSVARTSLDQEAQYGFHYDNRFVPAISSSPLPANGAPFTYISLDLVNGRMRAATAAEQAILEAPSPEAPRSVADISAHAGIRQAWLEIVPESQIPPVTRPAFRGQDGQVKACVSQSCTNAQAPIWLTSDQTRVRFLKREGWAQSTTAIYEWRPASNSTKRVYKTNDYLVDCRPVGDDLICARETSLRPRHLVQLDIAHSRATVLLDPNQDFEGLYKGKVERLYLRNDFGIESFADLVKPVDYRPGTSYPVVVVQYVSRGFLRGGTGDEYPIQALANRGYAVLSVQRPRHVGLLGWARNYTDVDAINLKDFADRRSVLSSIEIALQMLIERGLADKRRIGITGLSDGSSTVQFASLNSSMFAAGIVSACCWERTQSALFGPDTASVLTQIGWPNLVQPAADFWSHVSIAQNAKSVRFPILFQMADDEYLGAIESFTALRQANAPADMFVFPDEHHIKWQPAHRLAAYERTIDWFDFWLKDKLPSDPRRRSEAERWVSLRRR